MGQAVEVGRGERGKLLPPSPHASRLRLGSTDDRPALHALVSLTPPPCPALSPTQKRTTTLDGETSPVDDTAADAQPARCSSWGDAPTSAKRLQTSGKGSQLQPFVQVLAARDAHGKRQERRDRGEVSRKVNLSSPFTHRSFYMSAFPSSWPTSTHCFPSH